MQKYLKILWRITKDFSLINPNIYITNVKFIDFEDLKAKGIRYLVFDKDNTLTKTYEFNYYDHEIKETIIKAKQSFGFENMLVVSNSIEKDKKQENSQKSKIFINEEPLMLLMTKEKKPFNFDEILMEFGGINSKKVAVIGDRLLTDVLMANLNGALSVYLKPLDVKHEKLNIKVMRGFEEIALRWIFGKRRRNWS